MVYNRVVYLFNHTLHNFLNILEGNNREVVVKEIIVNKDKKLSPSAQELLRDPIGRLLSHESSYLSRFKAYLDSLPDWIGSESSTVLL